MSRKVGIAVSLFLALIFTLAIFHVGNRKYAETARTVAVVKTREFVPVGREIRESDVTLVEVPRAVAEGLATSVEDVVGKAPRVSLLKGQFVYLDALGSPGARPGHVVVYVPVNLPGSACVVAGERVDLYVVSKDNAAQKATRLWRGALVVRVVDQDGEDIGPQKEKGMAQMTGGAVRTPAAVAVEIPEDLAETLVQACSRAAVYLVRSALEAG